MELIDAADALPPAAGRDDPRGRITESPAFFAPGIEVATLAALASVDAEA